MFARIQILPERMRRVDRVTAAKDDWTHCVVMLGHQSDDGVDVFPTIRIGFVPECDIALWCQDTSSDDSKERQKTEGGEWVEIHLKEDQCLFSALYIRCRCIQAVIYEGQGST